jgi:hypothetical protein
VTCLSIQTFGLLRRCAIMSSNKAALPTNPARFPRSEGSQSTGSIGPHGDYDEFQARLAHQFGVAPGRYGMARAGSSSFANTIR